MKSIQTSGKQPLAKITQAQIQVMYMKRGCIIHQKMKCCFTGEQFFSDCVCVKATVLPPESSFQLLFQFFKLEAYLNFTFIHTQ
jgi:hypothetical protein